MASAPTYAYKIIPTAPPSPIPEEYPLSELDRTDGFVHLSTASQVSQRVTGRHPTGHTRLAVAALLVCCLLALAIPT